MRVYLVYLFMVSMLFGTALFLTSCGSEKRAAIAKIELLHTDVLNSLKTESKEEDIIASAKEYLVTLVKYVQVQQMKDASKINIKLLLAGKELADDLVTQYSVLKDDIVFRINEASVSMLCASYYEAKGEISDAVSMVESGKALFDDIVDSNPEDALARGYRAVNYSNLPNIFGKVEVVKEDFGMVLDYIAKTDQFDELEYGFFSVLLGRAKKFYERENDSTTLVTIENLQEKFSKE